MDYHCNPSIDYNCKRSDDAMKKTPRISETEWEVMKVVWAEAPCSASRIIEVLTLADATWHPKTIKAFLNRLVSKRVLGFRKEGRAYLYRPLVRESECVAAASESFLERVFGGSLKPMLAHFVERKKLSAAEVQELKELLETREPGSGRQSKQR
jgi:BlaI family transcriptional regulator, penicillinase repressor